MHNSLQSIFMRNAQRRQCAVIGEDLESFAKHAKRKQVNADDVLLYARKSADLQRHLRRQTDTKK